VYESDKINLCGKNPLSKQFNASLGFISGFSVKNSLDAPTAVTLGLPVLVQRERRALPSPGHQCSFTSINVNNENHSTRQILILPKF
jgi:hypothetical protein